MKHRAENIFEPQNEDERIQLQWMMNHHVFDKDYVENVKAEEERKLEEQRQKERKFCRSPASWDLPMPEQEIDLHGYTSEEAAAAIEEMMTAMNRAGMTVLRVIHGGGNPEYGNVKHIIDRKVRSEWKGKIIFYKTEPDNAGASIMKLAKPGQKLPDLTQLMKKRK